MAEVSITPLSSGRLTLEFPWDKIDELKRIAISRYGQFRVEKRASYEIIHIGECSFVSESEYDETALISENIVCDEVLNELYEALIINL